MLQSFATKHSYRFLRGFRVPVILISLKLYSLWSKPTSLDSNHRQNFFLLSKKDTSQGTKILSVPHVIVFVVGDGVSQKHELPLLFDAKGVSAHRTNPLSESEQRVQAKACSWFVSEGAGFCCVCELILQWRNKLREMKRNRIQQKKKRCFNKDLVSDEVPPTQLLGALRKNTYGAYCRERCAACKTSAGR